jgi:OmpA-OmpF porin, OOP family
MTRKITLGLAIAAFVLLCILCVWRHLPAFPPPTFSASLEQGSVVLRGVLPDLATKARVLEHATIVYGIYKDELQVLPGTGVAPWLASLPSLLPPLRTVMRTGGIRIAGDSIVVTGEVPVEEAKAMVLSALFPARASGLKVVDRLEVMKELPAGDALQFRLDGAITGKTVEFETGSDQLTERGRALLDTVGILLSRAPEVSVEIGGHTDARGVAGINEGLSLARANATKRYLVSRGIAGTRLRAVGYAAEKPVGDNSTADGMARNRRIEFTVIR